MFPLLVFLCFTTVSAAISPVKYDIKLFPDYENEYFSAHVMVFVSVNESTDSFELQVSKNLDIKLIHFEKNASNRVGDLSTGQNGTLVQDKKTETLFVTLPDEIPANSMGNLSRIDIYYRGKFGKKEKKNGLFRTGSRTFEANLKNGNVTSLFPVLEDVPIVVELTIQTPRPSKFETNLTPKFNGVYNGHVYNKFVSGDDTVKLSDVFFQIRLPNGKM